MQTKDRLTHAAWALHGTTWYRVLATESREIAEEVVAEYYGGDEWSDFVVLPIGESPISNANVSLVLAVLVGAGSVAALALERLAL